MQTGTNFSQSFQAIYEDDRSFLEKTVNDYPASPLSLFLLLQDYKRTKDPRFNDLAKKTSIYFQNTAWINYQLSGDELMKDIQKEQPFEVKEATLSETRDELQSSNIETDHQPENEIEHVRISSSEKIIEDEAIVEMEQEEKVEFVKGEEITDFEESFLENEIKEEDTIEDSPAKEDEQLEEHIIGEDELLEIEKLEVTEDNKDINTQEETIPMSEPSSGSEELVSPISADTGSEETANVKEENLPESTNSSSKKELAKEIESREFEFEPLHTIDYFASQGIIIREEALMDDKLGKQVKSFTDWLKSMKKLHPGKLPEQNEVVERIIQSSAELSNEDAGILTEAMAEVLLKQGKKGKAIEMFEKLSLMNPSKSIYFAAKIESLKNK